MRRFLSLTLEWGRDEPQPEQPPHDVAPARVEGGDPYPAAPELHIGFRPREDHE